VFSPSDLVLRAKVWLMEQQKLTEDKAYHLIRRVAINRNTKLANVAREIISGGSNRVI
jgi:AmiR/NasT family two-component response regulator